MMNLEQMVNELQAYCQAFILVVVPEKTGYDGGIDLAYMGDDRIVQALLLGLFNQSEHFLAAARQAIELYEAGQTAVEIDTEPAGTC